MKKNELLVEQQLIIDTMTFLRYVSADKESGPTDVRIEQTRSVRRAVDYSSSPSGKSSSRSSYSNILLRNFSEAPSGR